MRSAGIFQSLLSKSISSHWVPATSLGLTIVCNCHSIKQRVVILMFATVSAFISIGSSSGFKVGKCCFTGNWKALLIPAKGLAEIKPELTAYTITSFIRWQRRLTVSRLPLAAIGLMVSIALTADTLWIRVFPNAGKI